MLWIRPLMPGLSEKWWLLLAALALALATGCKPKIGDDCKISTDCSAAGDRLCDITAPGGYCTVYNCEPGTCPVDESLCVEFGADRSPVQQCEDQQSPSPYGRAFCMATCSNDSDCRSGYECVDLSPQPLSQRPNPWSALLIDTDRGDKACLVPFTAAPIDPHAPGEVCRAELPPNVGGAAGTGAVGGAAGTGAVSGAGGSVGVAGDAGAAGQGGAGG
jgi:hypothetical protein